jgi:hypothetical protein
LRSRLFRFVTEELRGRILSRLVGVSDHLLARVRGSLDCIDPRTDWPQGFVRFGVAACLAVVVALGLVFFVKAVERLDHDASQNHATAFDDRAFGGGNALGVDKEALNEARGRIPAREAYRLLVRPDAADLRNFVRYFLMPRRPDAAASWVLCYDCDLTGLADRLSVVWQNDAGIVIGRLGR